MGLLGTILAVLGLACSVYLWLELQKRPSNEHLREKLSIYSAELSETYAKRVREIETEWADMYSKFTRLAGRMDKTKALETAAKIEGDPVPAPVLTRSDILRGRNHGGLHNVKNVSA